MKRFVFFLTLGLVLAYVGVSFADADAGAAAVDASVNVAADAGVAAPDIVEPGDDPVGFVKRTYDAVKSGQWWLFASLLVIVLTWATRKWAAKIVPWFRTDRGGTVLAFSIALLGGLAHAVIAEGSPSWEMLTMSFQIALGAVGGYTGIHKVFLPSDGGKPKPSKPSVPTATVLRF